VRPVLDAVDEWLALVAAGTEGTTGSARARAQEQLEDDQSLHFHATDPGLSGTGEWLVTRTTSGVSIARGHGQADIVVRGPARSQPAARPDPSAAARRRPRPPEQNQLAVVGSRREHRAHDHGDRNGDAVAADGT
jgi:hypothetical protein